MNTLMIKPGHLTLADLRRIVASDVQLQLAPESYATMQASFDTVQNKLAQGQTLYGINTGFGLLAKIKIPAAQHHQLQRNLVLSHAAGTGEYFSECTVALIIALKINSLARGYSGVRPLVIEYLLKFFNARVFPCIPSKGSVGASGDIAPLAHLAMALLGEGEVRYQGEVRPAHAVLQALGLPPLELEPKEGLAILNGTQVSTTLALQGLFLFETCFSSAVVTGAMSLDAIAGSIEPFDARIHEVRGHAGQIQVAAQFRELLQGSQISAQLGGTLRVQDPYSIRCQPQVMGACWSHAEYMAQTLLCEANAVSDNPLVFAQDSAILSGGNFHAEPVALAADHLALCLAEVGALAERRIALLIDAHLSGLPAFLIHDGGINSGFMIAQVTAAALASENKSLAHPASVDSLPTSANQEDHVSMATFAARRLQDMADNTLGIIAIELLAAAQGLDLHKPLTTSLALQAVLSTLREEVAFLDKDRYFAEDIKKAKSLLQNSSKPFKMIVMK